MLIKAGGVTVPGSIDNVLVFDKLGRTEVDSAEAGDIVAIVGLGAVDIGDTIADPEAAGRPAADRGRRADPEHAVHRQRLAPDRRGAIPDVAPPEGAARARARVERRPARRADRGTRLVQVSGRGLLHLSVLIETMRREGYELAVGKPEVIFRTIDGETCEPYEFLVVDVPARPHRARDRAGRAPAAARWPRWTSRGPMLTSSS